MLAINLYLETRRLDRALNICYQLLDGIQAAEFKTIDDAYSGIIQGQRTLSSDERAALLPLFTAALDLQEAARSQQKSADTPSMFSGAMHIVGQASALADIYSAKRNLDLALSRSDQLGLAWLLRAQIRMEVLGEPKTEIMPDWNHAVALLPTCSAARSGRGWCWLGLKQFDQAVADLEAALELDPRNEFAHFGLAEILYHREEFDVAATHYETAISLPPRYNVNPNWNRGLWYGASCAHWGAGAERYRAGDSRTACLHTLRALELAEPEDRPKLWTNFLEMLAACDATALVETGSRIDALEPAFDSKQFQFCRSLVRLVALDGTGELAECDVSHVLSEFEQDNNIANELNWDFRERFTEWIDSEGVSAESHKWLSALTETVLFQGRGG